jgi:two-component system response regulator HydG
MGRRDALEPKPQLGWGPSKGKLLLADQDLADLQHYSAILTQLGYEVRAFASYGEAAACLGQEIFDLVLVSQGSPNFEGRSVLARAIEKDRHAPVLVLTDSIEIRCYLEAMQLGARDYIEKPSSPSEIGALVRRHLRTRSGTV